MRTTQRRSKFSQRSAASPDGDDSDNALYVASVEKAFRVLEARAQPGGAARWIIGGCTADRFLQKRDATFPLYAPHTRIRKSGFRPPNRTAYRRRCSSSDGPALLKILNDVRKQGFCRTSRSSTARAGLDENVPNGLTRCRVIGTP